MRGGVRSGAGRKSGGSTVRIRVPVGALPAVKAAVAAYLNSGPEIKAGVGDASLIPGPEIKAGAGDASLIPGPEIKAGVGDASLIPGPEIKAGVGDASLIPGPEIKAGVGDASLIPGPEIKAGAGDASLIPGPEIKAGAGDASLIPGPEINLGVLTEIQKVERRKLEKLPKDIQRKLRTDFGSLTNAVLAGVIAEGKRAIWESN